MHNRLDGAKARRLAAIRDELGDLLLLDSGDAIRAGNIYFLPWAEPALQRMNRLGYAAMAVGNREFHVFPSWLRRKLKGAEFPIVTCNVTAKAGRPVPYRPSIIVKSAGVSVGVIGVTQPMVREDAPVGRLSRFRFNEPVQAVCDEARRIRADCELVVVLAHTDHASAQRIAALPEVDLTLAGHTHCDRMELAPEAALIEGGSHAQWANVVRVQIEPRRITIERRRLDSDEGGAPE
jgi:5'-nucleotidase/UDP-sugar diphosphatase